MKKVDISGKKFGLLTAVSIDSIHEYPSGEKAERWTCKCECGNSCIVLRKKPFVW